jgi:hypothetical protein
MEDLTSPYVQRAIKIFLRNALKYEQNEDFVAHRPVTQAELEAFFANEGQGPNLQDLHFDMIGGLASDWNKRAFYLLTEQFCRELNNRKDVPTRSKAYVYKLISDQFTRLATIWKTGQCKVFDDDTWETNEELEERWTRRKDAQTHASRHAVRRFSVHLIVTMFSTVHDPLPFCRSFAGDFILSSSKFAQLKKISLTI